MKNITSALWHVLALFGLLEGTIDATAETLVDEALCDPRVIIGGAFLSREEKLDTLVEGMMEGVVEDDTVPEEYRPMVEAAIRREAMKQLRMVA